MMKLGRRSLDVGSRMVRGRAWRDEVQGAMARLVEPDADALRVPPDELVRVLRLLTFAGSHAEIADHHLMTPEEIVDTVLHGLLRRES